jgi:hypothetical protein
MGCPVKSTFYFPASYSVDQGDRQSNAMMNSRRIGMPKTAKAKKKTAKH